MKNFKIFFSGKIEIKANSEAEARQELDKLRCESIPMLLDVEEVLPIEEGIAFEQV